MTEVTIKIISTEDMDYQKSLKLRQKVLRKPIGLDIEDDDLSKEGNADHVLAYNKEQVVGTLFLLPVKEATVQMKQVAVDPDFQGKGIGKKLVKSAEKCAIDKGIKTIRLHARINAWPFYQSCGYTFASERFEERGITHKIMEKQLTN